MNVRLGLKRAWKTCFWWWYWPIEFKEWLNSPEGRKAARTKFSQKHALELLSHAVIESLEEIYGQETKFALLVIPPEISPPKNLLKAFLRSNAAPRYIIPALRAAADHLEDEEKIGQTASI